MRTLEEYAHMVFNIDKNIWNMIECTIQVIFILAVVLLLICKTKDRKAVGLDRYVHVLIAVLDFSDIL